MIHLETCRFFWYRWLVGMLEDTNMISQSETLDVLRQIKSHFAECYGVTSLGVFGSVARGQTADASDIDVVVEMREPNLFTLVHVKEELEEALREHVDIVHYRERMNTLLKHRIDREAIYV
jgi:predicted nucleotidyltransferase